MFENIVVILICGMIFLKGIYISYSRSEFPYFSFTVANVMDTAERASAVSLMELLQCLRAKDTVTM
jgi:hypothetical protein